MFKDTPIYEYCERLKALKGKEDEIFKLVLDNRTIRELIVFLNTEDQMGENHEDALGQKLFNRIAERTTYSPFDKLRAGKPYKLFEGGEYWRSFEAKIGNGFIIIESDPMKGTDNLEEMFGNSLEGLTEENLTILIQQAHEFFINWYRRYLLR